jgi:hypothetical protein
MEGSRHRHGKHRKRHGKTIKARKVVCDKLIVDELWIDGEAMDIRELREKLLFRHIRLLPGLNHVRQISNFLPVIPAGTSAQGGGGLSFPVAMINSSGTRVPLREAKATFNYSAPGNKQYYAVLVIPTSSSYPDGAFIDLTNKSVTSADQVTQADVSKFYLYDSGVTQSTSQPIDVTLSADEGQYLLDLSDVTPPPGVIIASGSIQPTSGGVYLVFVAASTGTDPISGNFSASNVNYTYQ